MKKNIFIVTLSLFLLLSGVFCTSAEAYDDIEHHWASTYIINMKNDGVLGQFESNSIYPDNLMNRAECAELISDFLEKYYAYDPPYDSNNYRFNDLIDGTRNTDKIRALSRLKYSSYFTSESYISSGLLLSIIDGYPDGDFGPYNLVTRAEFAKMLTCSLDCLGYLPVGNTGMYYSDIRDESSPHWGSRYIDICYGLQIMNGYYQTVGSDGIKYIEFRPDSNISRAEAIKMVSSGRNRGYIGMPGEHPSMSSTRYGWENSLYFID